jgi:hypothetical protein
MSSVGAKRAESGGKERHIRRPFHLDVQFPRMGHSNIAAAYHLQLATLHPYQIHVWLKFSSS